MKPKIAGNVCTVKGSDTRKPNSRIATITLGVQQIQNPATAAKSTRHVLISWAVIVLRLLVKGRTIRKVMGGGGGRGIFEPQEFFFVIKYIV